MPEISAILTLIPHAYIVLGEASLAATHNRLPGGRNLVPNDSWRNGRLSNTTNA